MYKTVILGEPAVGKTSIRRSYMGKNFTNNYLPTMGADFSSKSIEIDEQMVDIQIWDIAGQKSFQAILPRFLKNSSAAIIVFDLNRPETLYKLDNWIRKFQDVNQPDANKIPIFFVGNKVDLNQKIRENELEKHLSDQKQRFNLGSTSSNFIKTSAKTGENIDILFEEIVDVLVQ